VPAAGRRQKPVYLNGNPLNTYRRLHDGDRRCDYETIRRLMAERDDSRDIRVVYGSSIADLDMESLQAYRNMMGSHKPGHPWTTVDNLSLLRALGGWGPDPESEKEGLTLAGLLMLGQWPAISRAVPYYFVDYQERPTIEEQERDIRWLDRVVPDGTWSGNLFDFYLRVVRRLYADIKVPFVLKDNIRQDDTPVHKALREAMVNTLIHADYTDRASVLVIKQPAGFVFRNPGLLRVPATVALQGGASDCRNRALQQMFLMIGLGERAGSGMAKIQRGWKETGGKLRLVDSFEPFDQTRLEMDFAKTPEETRVKTPDKTAEKTPEKILILVKEDTQMSIAEIATCLGKSDSAIERAIRKLKAEGKLKRVGADKGGHWEVTDPHSHRSNLLRSRP
jgi:ATP-dependent DNA helicase RecG